MAEGPTQADPMYAAGVDAGLAAAAAFVEGRASMAREMGRLAEARILLGAHAGLLNLRNTDSEASHG